jgi:hypothetical protein
MQFNVQHAKTRLRLSDALMRQALQMMVTTLYELSELHLEALTNMQASPQPLTAADTPSNVGQAWLAYYQCLHGAMPMLQLITTSEFHGRMRRLCDALVQGQGDQVAVDVHAFQAELQELRTSIEEQVLNVAVA